jgi:carboxymethylenebutenolidase
MKDTNRRLTAADFHPEVLRLFDQYVHGSIDRRGFLEGAGKFADGGVTAAVLLEALSPKFAQAQVVKPTDARIKTEVVQIDSPSGNGKVRTLVARPAQTSKPLPVVLVAHENRGLNPHIEDIARRLAVDDFIAVAPDALTPLGGYPGDEDKARGLFAQLDAKKTTEDFLAGARYALGIGGGNGKLGVVGFCWGGGMANLLATRMPEVLAAAPFYGAAPAADQVAGIKARMFIVFAENDDRINSMWPGYEAALKAAHIDYEMQKFTGTQHGFNNDTTPRFDEAAAKVAWSKTVALFNRVLRG